MGEGGGGVSRSRRARPPTLQSSTRSLTRYMSRTVNVYSYIRIPAMKYITPGSPWLDWAIQSVDDVKRLVQADGCEFTTAHLSPHQRGKPEIYNYTELRCEGIRTLRGCPLLGDVYDRIYHHICSDRIDQAPYRFPLRLQGQQSVWAISPTLAEDYYFIHALQRIPSAQEERNGGYVTFHLVREVVVEQQQQFYLLKRYDRRECRIERIRVRGDAWKHLPVYRPPPSGRQVGKWEDFHRQLDEEIEKSYSVFAAAAYARECELRGTPKFALYRWYNPTNQFHHRIADPLRRYQEPPSEPHTKKKKKKQKRRKLTVIEETREEEEEEEETETETETDDDDDDDGASLLSV